MPTVLEEFQRRSDLLRNMKYDEDQVRVSGFLDWLEKEPLTASIVKKLRTEITIENLLEGCESGNPPQVSSPEEQARVGIFLMEKCREGKGLWALSHEYGIKPKYSTNMIQDFADEVYERFIEPTCGYLEDILRDQMEEQSVEDIALERLSSVFSPFFIETFPKTFSLLDPVRREFYELTETVNWFNVGTTCREALIAFAGEVTTFTESEISDEFKKGDAKQILKSVVKQKARFKKYEESLCNLIDSLWNHVVVILHRPTSSRDDATRAYLWTALLMTEIVLIFNSEIPQSFGSDNC